MNNKIECTIEDVRDNYDKIVDCANRFATSLPSISITIAKSDLGGER